MNLPNKLTMVRMFLVPVIVALLLLCETGSAGYYAAGVLFLLASFTDFLDGYLARKHNWITNFGKFMDPLADKLLVCSVLICLITKGLAPAWAVIAIVAREFAISGFRLIAVEKGVVLAASNLAKRKTNVQTLWVIYLLFPFPWKHWNLTAAILMAAAVILTVWSFVDYLLKNRSVLKD